MPTILSPPYYLLLQQSERFVSTLSCPQNESGLVRSKSCLEQFFVYCLLPLVFFSSNHVLFDGICLKQCLVRSACLLLAGLVFLTWTEEEKGPNIRLVLV